jgi:prenyltransferase beta subunit
MRTPVALAFLVLLPSASFAQTREIEDAIQTRIAALKFVYALEDPAGGFKPDPTGKAGLRATSSACRAIKYLGGKVPNPDRHAAFVLSCFDPQTGGFADAPGGKSDVTITSIGVMAAIELGVPKAKFAKAMDYLKANATTFEDVRIGAAAVEAWGVKECPFDLNPWLAIADKQIGPDGTAGMGDGLARDTASVVAMKLRLGQTEKDLVNGKKVDDFLQMGQRSDGGYGRAGAKDSDLESTYRVMRAFVLMRERPKDRAGMRAFLRRCRNADGGFGTKPGEKSSVGGVYYFATITKWLDEMEK